jgi:hypothetical protein
MTNFTFQFLKTRGVLRFALCDFDTCFEKALGIRHDVTLL